MGAQMKVGKGFSIHGPNVDRHPGVCYADPVQPDREKYLLALSAFKERLLASPGRDLIARIVAFGSVVKGTIREYSHLDVLIVRLTGAELSDWIADITLEVQMRHKVGIEPIVASIDEFFPLRSYFLFNILRYGWEIYNMSPEALKKEERRNLIHLADEYLSGARDAAEREHWRVGLDAAYNAAERMVKSLILKFDDDLPSSGLMGRFGELYVPQGQCEKLLGRKLNQALERRSQARYSSRALVGREDAVAMIELASVLKPMAEEQLMD